MRGTANFSGDGYNNPPITITFITIFFLSNSFLDNYSTLLKCFKCYKYSTER